MDRDKRRAEISQEMDRLQTELYEIMDQDAQAVFEAAQGKCYRWYQEGAEAGAGGHYTDPWYVYFRVAKRESHHLFGPLFFKDDQDSVTVEQDAQVEHLLDEAEEISVREFVKAWQDMDVEMHAWIHLTKPNA